MLVVMQIASAALTLLLYVLKFFRTKTRMGQMLQICSKSEPLTSMSLGRKYLRDIYIRDAKHRFQPYIEIRVYKLGGKCAIRYVGAIHSKSSYKFNKTDVFLTKLRI